MTYGTIKVDTVTFTNAGVDKSVTLSGLVQNPIFSGNVTVTGTLSGVTVTGTTANFTNGNFTNISGGTQTIASGVFAAGSAASPSITFTGDLNTGIYSPGADQVAISTGGSGRLFVDASGRLGIGTSSPNYTLDVAGTINANATVRTSNGTHIGILGSEAFAAGVVGVGSTSNHPLVLGTNSLERLRITSAGLVGIGTSSPQAKLEVVGGTNAIYSLRDTGNGGLSIADFGGGVAFGTSSGGSAAYIGGSIQIRADQTWTAGSSHPSNLIFSIAASGSTTPTERLRITSAGLVGIGTSSPTQLLTVIGSSFVGSSFNGQAIGDGSAERIRIGYKDGNPDTGLVPAQILTDATTLSIAARDVVNSAIRFHTGSGTSERVRIDGAGQVGIGTSTPSQSLQVVGAIASTGQAPALTSSSTFFDYVTSLNTARFAAVGNTTGTAAPIYFSQYSSNGSVGRDAVAIDSSGRVGIGTLTPDAPLHVNTTGGEGIRVTTASGQAGNIALLAVTGVSNGYQITNDVSNNINHIWSNANGERARIDSSGRLLVGTSSARANYFNSTATTQLQIEKAGGGGGVSVISASVGDDPAVLILGKSNNASVGGNTVVAVDNFLGTVSFQGNDGSEFVDAARISCYVDGTPGANDMPGRLVFSTTADGASSPTERMRIINDGGIYIGKTSGAMATKGIAFEPYATTRVTTDSTGVDEVCLYLNRQSSDGVLLKFFQENTEEGNISVSGTTVSYNGAHLSRWSQLPSGAERTEILRGSVLSNIDEMCEWGEEDNEQLNRMKVSDVEGDKNVSGVFQAWDDDDDTYINDFYCAMTGDFIIRIGAGVTVERGELLMSAGDGTAKPQDDDIIRSKTIAKVTSTNVSCTYDDGSYCVPCVLMAC